MTMIKWWWKWNENFQWIFSFQLCNLMRVFFKRSVWYLETRGDKTFLYPQGQGGGKKTGEVPTLDITCLPNVTLLAFSYLLRISNVAFQICVKLTPFFLWALLKRRRLHKSNSKAGLLCIRSSFCRILWLFDANLVA